MTNIKDLINQQKIVIVGVLVILISFCFTYDIPFFWDALSKSNRATWFYKHHFSQWVVPSEINSGHPPFWTLLLAFTWQLFGRTLLVSRLLLLFLNIGVVYQIQCLIKDYKIKNVPWYLYLIVFLEPTYLAQTTILNNDVLLLFMCLLATNTIFKNRVLYSVALTGILFCNLRGMLFFGGFFIFDAIISFIKQGETKNRVRFLLSYLLPIGSFSCFLYYQFKVLGWVFKSTNSAWETQRHLVDIKHFMLNIIATGWVFADFGRFFFWVVLVIGFFLLVKQKKCLETKSKQLILLWICLFTSNVGVMLFTSNPIGHRYFMFLYIIGLLIFINITSVGVYRKKVKKWIFIATCSFLISGHFWIYPEKMSQGWDSSLAYLNYFKLKKQMQNYVLLHNIPLDSIGTKTRNPPLNIEYLEQGKDMLFVNEAGLSSEIGYYLYTNIENDTKKEEQYQLKTKWLLLKEYHKNGVFVRLYKAPNNR